MNKYLWNFIKAVTTIITAGTFVFLILITFFPDYLTTERVRRFESLMNSYTATRAFMSFIQPFVEFLVLSSRAVSNNNFSFLPYGVILILIYCINYFIGIKTNESKAFKWIQKLEPLFRQEFKALGLTSDWKGQNNFKKTLLIQEGSTKFKFIASGNLYSYSFITVLEMKPRHNLFSHVMNYFFPINQDRINLEFAVRAKSPIVFAFARKNQMDLIKQHYGDIKALCEKTDVRDRKFKFEIQAESVEAISRIFTPEIVDSFNLFENLIEAVYASDLKIISSHKCSLRVSLFYLGSKKSDLERQHNLIRTIFQFLENIASYEMSEKVNKKIQQKRADFKPNSKFTVNKK